jgi:peptidyl-prolyl cis-trans isomerase B (cyclophilin B)
MNRSGLGLFMALMLAAPVLWGAENDKPAAAAATESAAPAAKEHAILKTAEGEMVIEFWTDVAPGTVANFIKLAKSGYYDGTAFHRIMRGFMIQGGDPKTKDLAKESEWGTGDPGYKIKAEFNERPHVRGVISMARSRHPDSAGSQFFICLDRAASLDRQYTGFGRLIKGEDVLLKLGDTEVGPSPTGERSRPKKRVVLESVKIVPAEVPAAAPAAAPKTEDPAK